LDMAYANSNLKYSSFMPIVVVFLAIFPFVILFYVL
jgi:hypothetical protein